MVPRITRGRLLGPKNVKNPLCVNCVPRITRPYTLRSKNRASQLVLSVGLYGKYRSATSYLTTISHCISTSKHDNLFIPPIVSLMEFLYISFLFFYLFSFKNRVPDEFTFGSRTRLAIKICQISVCLFSFFLFLFLFLFLFIVHFLLLRVRLDFHIDMTISYCGYFHSMDLQLFNPEQAHNNTQ